MKLKDVVMLMWLMSRLVMMGVNVLDRVGLRVI